MLSIEDKSEVFLAALRDAYLDETDREMPGYAKLSPSDNFADDLAAMLIAAKEIFEEICGEELDLLGFTYLLNRAAVNFVLHTPRERK